MNPAGSPDLPEPPYLPKTIERESWRDPWWVRVPEHEDLGLGPGAHVTAECGQVPL